MSVPVIKYAQKIFVKSNRKKGLLEEKDLKK